jgi:GNAT superfamily N-acetyltransferase
MIRPAAAGDVEAIRQVERRAGELFREIGMAEVADEELPSPSLVAGFVRDGRAWVDERDGMVAGFIVVRRLADACHVVQVSIDPAYRGQRIGAALIRHLEPWAVSHGLDALTLTTFEHVPWNAPYYERLGFEQLAPSAMTVGLAAVFEEEGRAFAAGTRVAMRRPLAHIRVPRP